MHFKGPEKDIDDEIPDVGAVDVALPNACLGKEKGAFPLKCSRVVTETVMFVLFPLRKREWGADNGGSVCVKETKKGNVFCRDTGATQRA